MSTHDRGAFGQLLAEAKALGVSKLAFEAHLTEPDESETRWLARAQTLQSAIFTGWGRTGEEAFRRLVEKLRGSLPADPVSR